MRILWVSHSSGYYGAERTIIEAAPELLRRGHEVQLVLPRDGQPIPRWEALGCPISRIDLRWWMNPGGWQWREALSSAKRGPGAVRALAVLAKRFRADVIVTNSIVLPQPALAARLAGIPHVWCIQEYGDLDHGMAFQLGRATTRRMVAALSDRVIVHSRAIGDHVAQFVPAERIDLVPYAVDTVPPASSSHDGPLVILGRIAPAKGQEDALRAITLLRGRGTEVKLDVVGSTGDRYGQGLEQLARELGVEDLVAFRGPTDQPQDWFGGARAALVCSRNEAFGRVTVEAMKAGAPVIGADSGGTAELIREGVTGYKYPPGDIGALADTIARATAEPEALRRMGEQAKAWADATFTSERSLDALLGSLNAATRLPGRASD